MTSQQWICFVLFCFIASVIFIYGFLELDLEWKSPVLRKSSNGVTSYDGKSALSVGQIRCVFADTVFADNVFADNVFADYVFADNGFADKSLCLNALILLF